MAQKNETRQYAVSREPAPRIRKNPRLEITSPEREGQEEDVDENVLLPRKEG